jgi:hypothetical protein
MSDGTTSDDFPSPIFTRFARRKPEHMAEAGLPEGAPSASIGISSLYWDDEILEKIVEATNQCARIKQKLLPAYLVRYRRWKRVSIWRVTAVSA